jgi:hypothetical protein
MLAAFSIVIPLVLAAVLVASGAAKLRTPDDLAGWADLGVPAGFRKEWLRQFHPWGELFLGLAVALLGGLLGVLASLVAVALMLAYTVLVARAAARADDTSCACFGTRKRVTRVTVARNLWLTILAVASAGVVWATPLFGGALAAGLPEWPWLLGLAIAAVTTGFVLWSDGSTESETVDAVSRSIGESRGGDEELDYVRTRTPAVPVMVADGTIINLRQLTAAKPLLLIAVSSTCGGCTPVIEHLGEWRALLPEIDVRLLHRELPEISGWTEFAYPQSLHDPEGYVSGSISDWLTPTAVLFGIDGMLAGGPETGVEAISAFVDDIYESLHGERPVRQASAG